jgi:uridine kinase
LTWKLCAIDGFGSAGKTTLARQLALDIPGSVVISLDEFFLPLENRRPSVYAKNYDLERLLIQVIEPVRSGSEIKYQRFDWGTGALGRDFIRIPRDSKVIIEGSYSLDIKLRDAYDFSIWVDTPESIRFTRVMDQGVSVDRASSYNLEELTYASVIDPKLDATLIISGASRFPATSHILGQIQSKLQQQL